MVRLKEILDRTNLQVAYRHFNDTPTLPFITYLVDRTKNYGADNKVYKKINRYLIELYTDYKDPETEQMLEDILDSEELFYDKYEDYIEKENLYKITYGVSMEVN